MAIKLSMAEILNEISKIKTKPGKIAYLQEHDNPAFRVVLRLIYDKDIELLIPDSAPPWNYNKHTDAQTMLYREARRLKIFIKGGGYDGLNQIKRESLFISLLEDIENADADLLANHLISHTPVKGLTLKTLEEAYPGILTSPMDMR